MRKWLAFVSVGLIGLVGVLFLGSNFFGISQLGSLLQSKQPRDLVLQASDLPSGFVLYDRVERVARDIDEEALSFGWIKGYLVRYVRGTLLNSTVIEQLISIYPRENMTKAFELSLRAFEDADRLTNPGIGDRSAAFRVMEGLSRQYVIIFQKGNVHETIIMSGVITDFELLNELALKGAAKI